MYVLEMSGGGGGGGVVATKKTNKSGLAMLSSALNATKRGI